MSGISTHVLDLATGKPARAVLVRLEADGVILSEQTTDDDGRVAELLGERTLRAETYRLTFVI
ncbi:MAG TPA: hydroxyisourate hydrolase, partial [Polyangiales bacterium]|nr:hydroxyisourate hydrolase [Polyangiales bacterium]